MEDFARLFETELGQVVVMLDENKKEKTELKFYFTADNLGTSSVSATMKDNSEKSYNSAKRIMNDCTTESVTEMIKDLLNTLTGE